MGNAVSRILNLVTYSLHCQTDIEWTRSGTNSPETLQPFTPISPSCDSINKIAKVGNLWESNGGNANVSGCLHVYQCFEDRCNSDDMLTTFSPSRMRALVQPSASLNIQASFIYLLAIYAE